MTLVQRLEGAGGPMRITRSIQRGKEIAQGVGQLRLVVLHRQHVVALGLPDLSGNGGLASHGVDRYHGTLQRQHRQQLLDGRDLVGFFRAGALPQGQPVFGSISRHQVQGALPSSDTARTAQRLAVDGDHPPRHRRAYRAHPTLEACLQFRRRNRVKHPAYRVVTRNAVPQPQEAPQPRFPFLPPGFDIVPAFGSRHHRAQRQDHNIEQIMISPAHHPRIGQVRKKPHQARTLLLAHALHSQKSRVDAYSSGSTSPCHKSMAVNEFSCSGPGRGTRGGPAGPGRHGKITVFASSRRPAGSPKDMTTSFAKETLPISLEEEMRHSYLDYAMSVIVGRALPDVRDGLKPVHRRVLFAMHELSNDWNRPYKKSARIVGDVIGKYHPHGDQSVYDTIVRLAQDFSMRHMLVDGQGNFGSVDGDNAAAMRYTEIRLAKIAHEMLADIDNETVDFGPNYDGSHREPLVLPSRLPNLLVNGSGGIAVGMATNIPPHNLNEVVDACLHLLRNPEATIDELMEIVPAPDFPTAAIIYGINGVKEGYRTGRGKVVMRAKCHFEDIDRGQRQAIIVDELPYQVNKKTLQERMAELVNEKKIEGISHIQDESDKSGMRLVIELKRGEVPEVVLNNLYKQTQLQDTFGINMVALVNGQPKLCTLKDLIEVFLQHRREVVTRRTVFELRKARERGHILEGLAIALANIDEFIAIIRNAPTPPVAKTELMSRPWDSKLVREMLTRARADGGVVNADDYRPDGLGREFGMGREGLYRLSD